MKLLYLAPLDPSLRQGHAAHVRHLVAAFQRRGHEVALLTREPSSPVPWIAAPTIWRTVGRLPVPKLGQLLSELQFLRTTARLAREWGADVILARIELYSAAPLGLRGLPLIAEVNSHLPAQAGETSLRGRLAAGIEGRVLRHADAVGAVSASLRDRLITRYDLAPESVHIIPNGAELPNCSRDAVLAARRSHAVSDDTFLIGYFGSLQRHQSVDRLLHMLTQLPRARYRLWVGGTGEAERELKRNCRKQGIEGEVDWLGALDEDVLSNYAAACQILTAPYDAAFVSRNGLDPLKALVALAVDRPLLATRLAVLNYVEPDCGELIAREDPESWADAVSRWRDRWLLAGAPLLDWPWPFLEGPGRRWVERHRTWDHTAAAWDVVLSAPPTASKPQ